MRHAMAVLLALPLGFYSILQAQLPIEVGQRVRITSVQHGVHDQAGHVLSTTGDSVVLLVKGTRTIAVPVTAIDRLEVLKATSRATARGVRIGGAWGMLAGFVYGIASYDKQCPPHSDDPTCTITNVEGGPVVYGIAGAAGGAFIGAGIGALIGSAFHEHRWVTVPTNRAPVVTRALPGGGIGVGLTLSL